MTSYASIIQYVLNVGKIINYYIYYWFLFYVCITNSFILSKLCNSTSSQPTKDGTKLKAFRFHLPESLISSYTSRKHTGQPQSLCTAAFSGGYTVTGISHASSSHQKVVSILPATRDPPAGKNVYGSASTVKEHAPCLTGKEDGSDCWSL